MPCKLVARSVWGFMGVWWEGGGACKRHALVLFVGLDVGFREVEFFAVG